ncbi:UNVERIFIED_ORG: hypothetical protein GGE63_001440 [Rhizobium esperanzae]
MTLQSYRTFNVNHQKTATWAYHDASWDSVNRTAVQIFACLVVVILRTPQPRSRR